MDMDDFLVEMIGFMEMTGTTYEDDTHESTFNKLVEEDETITGCESSDGNTEKSENH